MIRNLYIKLAILLLITAGLFYDTFIYMLDSWSHGDNNYCYLIPLVVAYLIWDKKEELEKELQR